MYRTFLTSTIFLMYLTSVSGTERSSITVSSTILHAGGPSLQPRTTTSTPVRVLQVYSHEEFHSTNFLCQTTPRNALRMFLTSSCVSASSDRPPLKVKQKYVPSG